MKVYDVAVIGGGASGLAACISASKGGRKVVLLEKNDRVGKKIVASGNGRCNLSNKNIVTDSNYNMYNNRKFVTYALNSVDNSILKSFLDNMGLLTTYEKDRMYPYSMNSSQVIDAFRKAIQNKNVKSYLQAKVTGISKANDIFTIKNNIGKDIYARAVIVATGSGAGQDKPFDYFLKEHCVTELKPSLVPIRTDLKYIKGLNGVRAKARVNLMLNNECLYSEDGEVQFKNFGVSGVCIFSASSYISRNINEYNYDDFSLVLDLMPEFSEKEVVEKLLSKSNIYKDCLPDDLFVGLFHKNIGLNLLKQANVDKTAPINYEAVLKLAEVIKNFKLQVVGLPPMSVAQVACGGYDVKNFSKHSFESRIVAGLFVVGEALDIDGICGGYNMHFALASGLVAGRKVGEYLDRSL